MSISSIEDLSNELFYEILEYLDGCDMYQAFFELNHRFEELLQRSPFLYKTGFYCSKSDDFAHTDMFRNLLRINKQQIISFHMNLPMYETESFFSSYPIDASFSHLECLDLCRIQPTVLPSLLASLSVLPRLSSLTIDLKYASKDLGEVYQTILTLPQLKYLHCSADDITLSISLPFASDEQFSPIERLVLYHPCTFLELCAITSYTPDICRLKLTEFSESDPTFPLTLPDGFLYLTHLSIDMCCISYEELATFLRATGYTLQVLRVSSRSNDLNYLDGDQWKHLIVNYLPDLETFYLQYYQDIDPESGSLMSSTDPNPFVSSFWSERQWLLEADMDSFEIAYSIESYKKRWYDDINSPIDLSKSTRLILTSLSNDETSLPITINLREVLRTAWIYHLELAMELTSDELISIISTFPRLDSLKISSLLLIHSKDLNKGNRYLHPTSKKSNITKLYVENFGTMNQICFLLELCPRMTYLKVNLNNSMDIELFLTELFNRADNKYFRTLCLHVATADDPMIEALQEMITRTTLIRHFTIERQRTNICLQWK